jgi:hypothetical protein
MNVQTLIARNAIAAAALTWTAGLLAAASCLGLPFAVAALTAVGAGAFASEHALLIPVFEVMLLCTAATAAWLARRTGLRGVAGYLVAAVLMSGVGIFFHAAPVIAGMGLVAFVIIRVVSQARTAGTC